MTSIHVSVSLVTPCPVPPLNAVRMCLSCVNTFSASQCGRVTVPESPQRNASSTTTQRTNTNFHELSFVTPLNAGRLASRDKVQPIFGGLSFMAGLRCQELREFVWSIESLNGVHGSVPGPRGGNMSKTSTQFHATHDADGGAGEQECACGHQRTATHTPW